MGRRFLPIALCIVRRARRPRSQILYGKRIFLMIPLRASCHPERSEGSARRPGEMLRYAQHDMMLGHFKISASLSASLLRLTHMVLLVGRFVDTAVRHVQCQFDKRGTHRSPNNGSASLPCPWHRSESRCHPRCSTPPASDPSTSCWHRCAPPSSTAAPQPRQPT